MNVFLCMDSYRNTLRNTHIHIHTQTHTQTDHSRHQPTPGETFTYTHAQPLKSTTYSHTGQSLSHSLIHTYIHTHTGAVTSLDFHPSQILLASGSTDRTVKFVDLETLTTIGQTRAEGSGGPVSAAVFSADGDAVLCVSGDYLKVPIQLFSLDVF